LANTYIDRIGGRVKVKRADGAREIAPPALDQIELELDYGFSHLSHELRFRKRRSCQACAAIAASAADEQATSLGLHGLQDRHVRTWRCLDCGLERAQEYMGPKIYRRLSAPSASDRWWTHYAPACPPDPDNGATSNKGLFMVWGPNPE
jgi:hypothetical protein